jgi:hypothetical protein
MGRGGADGKPWVYLRHVYEDERLVEERLRQLEGRSDIELRIPMTDARRQTSRRAGCDAGDRQGGDMIDGATSGLGRFHAVGP